MVEFKDRLIKAMSDAGVSTQQLADAMGVSYQAVRKAQLGGSSALTAINNAKAAKFLRVDPNWLATGRGADDLAETPETFEKTGMELKHDRTGQRNLRELIHELNHMLKPTSHGFREAAISLLVEALRRPELTAKNADMLDNLFQIQNAAPAAEENPGLGPVDFQINNMSQQQSQQMLRKAYKDHARLVGFNDADADAVVDEIFRSQGEWAQPKKNLRPVDPNSERNEAKG